MAPSWTQKQLNAIETRDRTLLVSAAAGSGKTATLTERIIRSLTDKENPASVSELLVVTYTKAAAAELRAKIARALENAVAADPTNEHLLKQLYMLPSAKIRTIDSYCNDILRSNTDKVGITSGYRIADAAELAILSKSILEGLIEAVYSGIEPGIATPDEFEELADCLTGSKNVEDLSEVLHLIWRKCSTAEDGVGALLPLIEHYDPEKFETVEKSIYGARLMKNTKEMLTHYRRAIASYRDRLDPSDKNEAKYKERCETDISLADGILECESYELMRERVNAFAIQSAPSIRGYDKPCVVEDYLVTRSAYKSDVEKIKKLYSFTSDNWRTLFVTLHKLLLVLYRFELRFDSVYLEEKIRRGALGYDDIERFTYNLLIRNGERTDVAKSIEKQFSAIYIDEYQDVNSLQNKIFEAISRPDNRFMVGDIKQSIYGFRYARPEIFAEMKSRFPEYPEKKDGASAIFMANNFRCDEGVVNFVNGIFDRVFGLIGDSIGYVDGDKLVYSKIHDGEEPPIFDPKLYMLDKDSEISEPDAVAAKIKSLIDTGKLDNGAAVRACDVAIILRSATGKSALYSEALARVGVSSQLDDSKDFFLSAEVLLALCLLNSIDNPSRDIYLAGLMCSPLYGFTGDDLFLIRSEGAEGSTLYDALVSYTAAHTDFTKGVELITSLSHYRAIAEGIGVDTLIYRLYYDTGLMALAAANGGKDNLMLLYDYARRFEGGAFKGLYNFIAFINNLIDKDSTFDENRDADSTDAVKIITCHSSKGLEYPIVFLCETGRSYSTRDLRQPLAFDDCFGISFRTRTPSGLCVVDSPVHDIINGYIKNKSFEEELRVLYVALTRAREQLYVTGTCPSVKREEYEHKIDVMRKHLSPYSIRTASSNLEVMLLSMPEARAHSLEELVPEEYMPHPDTAECEDECIGECTVEPDWALADELYTRFTYEYPEREMTSLPEKMSVSRMSPTVLDDTENTVISLFEVGDEALTRTLPAFVSGNDTDESARRGIATHYFMQFFDIEKLRTDGARAELSRLISEGFISERDGERVRIREIERFARSRLFSDMLGARRIYREFRFNTELAADLFTTEEGKREAYSGKNILVQGVIDCIIEHEDGSIGLYDYKTDRLTSEELSDPTLAREKLRDRHGRQLYYYSLAIERIFGRSPARIEVYSLALGDSVDVRID